VSRRWWTGPRDSGTAIAVPPGIERSRELMMSAQHTVDGR
jgi:hypothetical protein